MIDKPHNNDPIVVERLRRQRGRNLVVFMSLLAFVGLVYAVTVIKIRLGYGL